MVSILSGAGEGGGGCLNVGNVIHYGGLGGTYVWVEYVGYVPTH